MDSHYIDNMGSDLCWIFVFWLNLYYMYICIYDLHTCMHVILHISWIRIGKHTSQDLCIPNGQVMPRYAQWHTIPPHVEFSPFSSFQSFSRLFRRPPTPTGSTKAPYLPDTGWLSQHLTTTNVYQYFKRRTQNCQTNFWWKNRSWSVLIGNGLNACNNIHKIHVQISVS